MELPAGWHARPATLDDVPAILAIMVASDLATIGEPDSTGEDVTWIFREPDAVSVLALDPAGTVVSWANVINPNRGPRTYANVFSHPDSGGPTHRPLLAWCLTEAARQAGEWGLPSLAVRASGVPAEKEYLAAVREAGFTFLKRYARMRVTLPAPMPSAGPAGTTIRPIDHEDEAELRAVYRVQQSAFADTPDFHEYTFERWVQRINQQTAVPWDEWFVALVDDGIVGMLESAEIGAEQNEGWVHNLAVLGGYRGRGIARALLGRAFAAYTANGCTAAGLGVDLTNPTGAYRLYESAGMHTVYENDIYERTVVAR
jgi:ribosomal protein S18 acetylase RimI-like enzyme